MSNINAVRRTTTMHLKSYADVLFEVSKNLSEKEQKSRAWNVLCNMKAPESALTELAKDTREWVRICVAAHPNTSTKTLEYLANL